MCRPIITLATLCLCVLSHVQADAETTSDTNDVTIELIESKVTEKTLEIRYRIVNHSDQDVWLCEQVSGGASFRVFPGEDGQTLVVQRRFDVPLEILTRPPTGSYVCLRATQTRVESVMVPVPVSWVSADLARRIGQDVLNATRLVLEIGFYCDDLPEKILSLLEARGRDGKYVGGGTYRRPSTLFFSLGNENVRDREERVVFNYSTVYEWESLRAEVLQLTLENQTIPYWKIGEDWRPFEPPDFGGCTQVEIRCQPNVLAVLFPYPGEQALLSFAEKAHIDSQQVITSAQTTLIPSRPFARISRRDTTRESLPQVRRHKWSALTGTVNLYPSLSMVTNVSRRRRGNDTTTVKACRACVQSDRPSDHLSSAFSVHETSRTFGIDSVSTASA